MALPPYARVVRGRERYLLRTRLLEPTLGATLGLAARIWRALRHGPIPADIPPPRRLLVIHRLRIGDAVVITPLLRALRARFPQARMALVVCPLVADLMTRASSVDRIVSFSPRGGESARRAALRAAGEAGPADVAFVLDFTRLSARIAGVAGASIRIGYDNHGRGMRLTHTLPWPPEWYRATVDYKKGTEPRHQAERWLALGALVGASTEDAQPRLDPDRSRRWQDLLPGAGFPEDAGVLVIHPGSDPAFRWRPERWAAVVDTLAARHGLRVVISGGPADGPVIAAVRALMKSEAPDIMRTGLVNALDIVSRAAIVLTVDTSLAHLASAVATPAVVLSGPSDSRIWRPYGEPHVVVSDPESRCGGCKQPRCALKIHLCMEAIEVEEVLRAAEGALARSRPPRSAGAGAGRTLVAEGPGGRPFTGGG